MRKKFNDTTVKKMTVRACKYLHLNGISILATILVMALLITQLPLTVPVFASDCPASSSGHFFLGNGICGNCGGFEPATSNNGTYEIINAGNLYWFAEQVNAGNTSYNAKLMNDISLNSFYNYSFDPDTGLVKASRANYSAAYYIGTGQKGNNSGANTIFDSTASVKGQWYSSNTSTATISEPTGSNEWIAIGSTKANPFTGDFNGNCKTISRLYYNDNTATYFGMFGYIGSGGFVHDVTVTDSFINGNNYLGGLCAVKNGDLVNCSFDGIIVGGNNLGGLCITNKAGEFSSCYFTGTVMGSAVVGGVCAINDSTIENCYNMGTIKAHQSAGGVSGANNGIISSCYNTGTIIGNYTIGSVNGSGSGSITNSFYLSGCAKDGTGFVQNGIGASTSGTAAVDVAGNTDGRTAEQFADGTVVTYALNGGTTQVSPAAWQQGTANPILVMYQAAALNNNGTTTNTSDDYYEIYNERELYWFAARVNAGNTGYNAKLMDDINLNPGISFAFDPDTGLVNVTNGEITAYLGTSIKGNPGGNTAFDTSASTKGRIYKTNTSSQLYDTMPFDVLTWTPIGSNAGSSPKKYAGTFSGNGKTVSGLYFKALSTSYIGLFGYINGGTVKDLAVADSYIYASTYVGGVFGGNNGTVINCTNSATVGVNNNYLGGVGGYNYGGVISKCYNTGTVNGSQNNGGVCGYNAGTMQYCYNTGEVKGSNVYAGGVCGGNSGTITNCYNVATVNGDKSQVGGVVGGNIGTGSAVKCYYLSGCAKDGNGIVQKGIGSSTQGSYTNDVSGKTAGKTDTQFIDGTVTYELNGGTTQVNPLIWYQNIDVADRNDITPVLDSTHKAVIKARYIDGFLTTESTGVLTYVNSPASEYMPLIRKDNGTKYDLTDDYYEISNAGQLYWFASVVNSGSSYINGKLMNDINVNPGYTFTFEPDSGLVKVEYYGTTQLYLGTDLYGEPGGPSTNFDASASYHYTQYQTNNKNWTVERPEALRDWVPIGRGGMSYKGTFEGNGKTVSGMFILDTDVVNAGLFGSIGGGVVKNLATSNFHMVATVVGGVCGRLGDDSIIENCSSDGILINYMAGGVCGNSIDAVIKNCYSTSLISSATARADNPNVDGICGGFSGSTKNRIENCYYLSGKIYNSMQRVKVYYTDVPGEIEGKTLEQFENGEVTYELNGGATQVSPSVWYQNIDNGQTVDSKPKHSGGTVYYGYVNCGSEERVYSNTPKYTILPAHTCSVWNNNTDDTHGGTCTVCQKNIALDHVFSAVTNANGTHTRTCSVCGYVLTQNHVYGEWTTNGNSTHIRTCSVCNYNDIENHNIGSITHNGIVNHIATCTVCNGRVYEDHVFGNWSSLGYTKHLRICSVCSYRDIEDHIFSELVNNNDGTHTRTCPLCNESETEDHIYETATDNGNGKHTTSCSICNNILIEDHRLSVGTLCEDGKHERICVLCEKVYVETHAYTDTGYCEIVGCDLEQPATLNNNGTVTVITDDYYEIANAGNLFWFAKKVNAGEAGINGKLINDVNLDNRIWTPIGKNEEAVYSGVFDGDNHKITGLNNQVKNSNIGLFGIVSGTNAKICNMTVYGNMDIVAYGTVENLGGIVARLSNDATISNCISYVEITLNTNCEQDKIGGVCGSAGSGHVERCAYYGKIELKNAPVKFIGGVVGHSNGSLFIENCGFFGIVDNFNYTKTDLRMGGILGGLEYRTGFIGIKDCFSNNAFTGEYYGGTRATIGAIIGYDLYDSQYIASNNYYLNGRPAWGYGRTMPENAVTLIDAEDVSSGKLCYDLNGGKFDDTRAWYQNIDNGQTIDEMPKFTGGTVYSINDTYTNVLNCFNLIDSLENKTNKLIYTDVTAASNLANIVAPLYGYTLNVTPSRTAGGTDYCGTGSTITVSSGDTSIETYTLVVNGDVNGDSNCDALDCMRAELALNGHYKPSTTEELYYDVDKNGEYDIMDFQDIMNHAVGAR